MPVCSRQAKFGVLKFKLLKAKDGPFCGRYDYKDFKQSIKLYQRNRCITLFVSALM